MFAIGFMQCLKNSIESEFELSHSVAKIHHIATNSFGTAISTAQSFAHLLCVRDCDYVYVCVIESCFPKCGDILLELTLVKQNYVYIVSHLESFCIGFVCFLFFFVPISNHLRNIEFFGLTHYGNWKLGLQIFFCMRNKRRLARWMYL